MREKIQELYNDDILQRYLRYALQIQEKLGYFFINETYLFQALAVRGSRLPPNEFERLEYLGDSILGAIVGLILFKQNDDFNPGDLTKSRAKLIKNEHLATLADELGLTDIADVFDIPSLSKNQKADLVEALVGAIFMDTGENFKKTLDVVSSFIYIGFNPERQEWEENPKGYLVQQAQKLDVELSYEVTKVGPQNAPTFTATVHVKKGKKILHAVTGDPCPKKKEAEKSAARKLIQILENSG